MKTFDTRVYSISDFIEWDANDLLNLSPEFQRRSVWNVKAKSYLIDSVIRGKPIPKILLTQELVSGKNKRTVVDGQQRLRAILEFVDDGFKISRAHNREYANKSFSTLPNEIQIAILKYEVGVDILFDATYREILDIFARLNTFSVRLNPQEQLNAKYLGYFKQYAYELGYDYVEYWLRSGVLTKSNVSRMSEARLASDLLMAATDGVQTNKNLEAMYKRFEDNEGALKSKSRIFHETMSLIGDAYSPEDLKGTNFKRIHLFYSLFCSIAHCLRGIDALSKAPRPSIKGKAAKVRIVLDDLSSKYDDPPENDKGLIKFIDYSRRATTDTARRIYRSEYICRQLNKHF